MAIACILLGRSGILPDNVLSLSFQVQSLDIHIYTRKDIHIYTRKDIHIYYIYTRKLYLVAEDEGGTG